METILKSRRDSKHGEESSARSISLPKATEPKVKKTNKKKPKVKKSYVRKNDLPQFSEAKPVKADSINKEARNKGSKNSEFSHEPDEKKVQTPGPGVVKTARENEFKKSENDFKVEFKEEDKPDNIHEEKSKEDEKDERKSHKEEQTEAGPKPSPNKPNNEREKRKERLKVLQDQCPAISVKDLADCELMRAVDYRIPHSRSWNKKNIAVLNSFHPCTLDKLHKFNKNNGHPLCAALRNIAEAKCITLCQESLKMYGEFEGKILDVGGSVKRHHDRKRKQVFSCVPSFEAKDLLRNHKLPGENYARKFWNEMGHWPISMSVHSLYYITPEEVFSNIIRQKIPIHYAVVHRFPKTPEGKGELMHGEMSYVRCKELVSVTAAGSLQKYVHSNMDWLNSGQFNAGLGTLTWEIAEKYSDVYVIKFIASMTLEEIPARVGLDNTQLFKNIYHSCIDYSKPRNQGNYKSFLKKAKDLAVTLELDIAKAQGVFAEMYLNDPTPLPQYNAQHELLTKKHNGNLEWKQIDYKPIIRVIAFGIVLTTICYIFERQVAQVLGWTSHTPWVVWTALIIFSCFMVGIKPTLLEDTVRILAAGKRRKLNIFYVTKKLLNLVKIFDYCYQGPPAIIDNEKKKLLKYREPVYCISRNDKECLPGVAAYAMVYNPNHLPCMPRRCVHNFKACVEHRVLNKTPVGNWENFKMPPEMVKAAKIIRQTLKPLEVEEWLAKFPGKKARKLRADLKDESFTTFIKSMWNESKVFIKREFYSLFTKAPRPIHAAGATFVYSTGRWLSPLAEELILIMPENILFPLHGDSVEIGNFAAEAASNSEQIVVTDFSKFDSTQWHEALVLILNFFLLCGIPSKIVDLMSLDTVMMTVRGPFGMKYTAKNFRASGRGETLLGNTILAWAISYNVFKNNIKYLLVKGDDCVIYLRRKLSSEELEVCRLKYLHFGFLIKFEVVEEPNTEFCSSLVMKTLSGHVLVPKPGRFLTKTLWCKNTEYKPEQVQEQFAGILNGVKNVYKDLPVLKALYKHPIYLKYHGTQLSRNEYNEYSKVEVQYDKAAVYEQFLKRYDLFASDILEMEEELATANFPIKLSHHGFDQLAEVDWCKTIQTKGLVENSREEPEENVIWLLLTTVIEECFLLAFPYLRIIVGVIESFMYGDLYNLICHSLLFMIALQLPILAAAIHIAHNLLPMDATSLNLTAGFKTNKYFKYFRMPKRNNKNRNQRKPRRRVRQPRPRATSDVQMYAAMVADPCNGPLIDGFYSSSEGMLNKLKSVATYSASTANGYVLWDPSFMSSSANPGAFNVFVWENADATLNPTNTTGVPFGAGTTSASKTTAGASAFCQSDTVSDSRCIGGCMRVTYKGRMDASSGLVAALDNIPAEAILGANGVTPVSVDELFQLSTMVERMGIDTLEVKYKPNDTSHLFRSNSEGLYNFATGAVTTITDEAERSGSHLMGFAFQGISSFNDLVFEFHQNVEWRPNVDAGFVIRIPKQIKDAGHAQKIVRYLDSKHPNWWTNVTGQVTQGATALAQAAFTGAFARGTSKLMGQVTRRSLGYLAAEAPLLLL